MNGRINRGRNRLGMGILAGLSSLSSLVNVLYIVHVHRQSLRRRRRGLTRARWNCLLTSVHASPVSFSSPT